ncbi:MAG: type II secretion system F family protein [Sphingomicrobium sp.]
MLEVISQNQWLRLLLLIAVFLAVVAVGYVIALTLAERQATRRRLLGQGSSDLVAPEQISGSLRSQGAEDAWLKIVNAIEKAGLSLVDTKNDAVRQRLIAAGYTAPYAPRIFTLVRLAMVIGLPLCALLMFWIGGSTPSLMRLYFTLTILAALGLYLPNIFIRAKADRRQQQIINGFPDALDLMLVCVEAGLGLEAAFGRVGQEMIRSHPLLAEQLGAVVLELRAGRSREDALRRMADRAGADEIRAFATLLIQSTKLGSSVGQTLRIYASEMRERRRMRAEEKAHRLPVLLSIPLVVCMLPVMIGVLMLPAVIRVIRTVLPAMTGG